MSTGGRARGERTGVVHSRTGDAQREGRRCPYRRRVLRSPKVVLAGAGLALSLAACGATPDAAPAPAGPSTASTPSSAAAAPTPTPSETSTSVATVQVEEPTFTPTGTFNENDALAFGQYYLQVLNHVRVTGDPALLKSLSSPTCGTCASIAAGTLDLRDRGLRYTHPELEFHAAYLDYFDASTQEADVRVEFSGDLGELIDQEGSVVEASDPLDHVMGVVRMRMLEGQWTFEEAM